MTADKSESKPARASDAAVAIDESSDAADGVSFRGLFGLLRQALTKKIFQRPAHPWLIALGIVVAVTLLMETSVRLVENQFASVRAGDSAEMILKAAQVDALGKTDPKQGVVFFGNSMMDTAISPKIFVKNSATSKSAYNAAVVGAPLVTRLRWADEIVLRSLNPDLIVLGVHPVDLLHTDFLKLNQDPGQADFVFSKVLRETDTSIVGATERVLDDRVALVRNRGVIREPKTLWDATVRTMKQEKKPHEFQLRTQEEWQDLLNADGEISLFHKVPFKPESITNTGVKIRENFQTKNFSTAELQSLLESLRATGKKVVVVIPPIPVDAWQEAGVPIDVIHQGNQMIVDTAALYDMRVVDFTDRGYRRNVFGDVLHTNEFGSLQFSKELAKELDKPG